MGMVDEDDDSPGWVLYAKGDLPAGAVEGGYIGDVKLYIGRGMLDGCWVPGFIHGTEKELHVAWKKKEVKIKKFQVLVYSQGSFEPLTVDDEIPKGSVSTEGCLKDDDVFIGRAKHAGCLLIGRITPSEGACFVSYNGESVRFTKNFEIYTMREHDVSIFRLTNKGFYIK